MRKQKVGGSIYAWDDNAVIFYMRYIQRPLCNQQRANTFTQCGSGSQQGICIGVLKKCREAEFCYIQLSFGSPLVQCFHIFQKHIKRKTFRINFLIRERIKNKGIIWAGRESK